LIFIGAAEEPVRAQPGAKGVSPAAADHEVVPLEAEQRVAAAVADQDIASAPEIPMALLFVRLAAA
jgi:hypothetical protein